MSENFILQWLENLGYDKFLYPVRSRCFVMSFHSDLPVSVKVKDAVTTDLDTRTSLLVMEKFGHEQKKSKQGYRLLYTFSDKILGYTYGVQNTKDHSLKVTLDVGKSSSMIHSTPTTLVTKTIQAGETEFFLHSVASPNKPKFSRVVDVNVEH
jgi:hypothetical protein